MSDHITLESLALKSSTDRYDIELESLLLHLIRSCRASSGGPQVQPAQICCHTRLTSYQDREQ